VLTAFIAVNQPFSLQHVNMETESSSETLVCNQTTWRNSPKHHNLNSRTSSYLPTKSIQFYDGESPSAKFDNSSTTTVPILQHQEQFYDGQCSCTNIENSSVMRQHQEQFYDGQSPCANIKNSSTMDNLHAPISRTVIRWTVLMRQHREQFYDGESSCATSRTVLWWTVPMRQHLEQFYDGESSSANIENSSMMDSFHPNIGNSPLHGGSTVRKRKRTGVSFIIAFQCSCS
jgi:hypothetical protein